MPSRWRELCKDIFSSFALTHKFESVFLEFRRFEDSKIRRFFEDRNSKIIQKFIGERENSADVELAVRPRCTAGSGLLAVLR